MRARATQNGNQQKQVITPEQIGLLKGTIKTWVDDIAENAADTGLARFAFKAIESKKTYDKLKDEFQQNNILDSIDSIRKIYNAEDPGSMINEPSIEPSQVKWTINQFTDEYGGRKIAEKEIQRRSVPITRHSGYQNASAPTAPIDEDYARKPAAIDYSKAIIPRAYTRPIVPPTSTPTQESLSSHPRRNRPARRNESAPDKRRYARLDSSENLPDMANFADDTSRWMPANKNAEPIMPVRDRLTYVRSRNFPTAVDSMGRKNLHIAATNNDPKTIKELVEAEANIEATYDQTPTRALNISYNKRKGSNNPKREVGLTALHEAAKYNSPDAIRQLAKSGASLNKGYGIMEEYEQSHTPKNTNNYYSLAERRFIEDRTALHVAAINNNTEVIKELSKQPGLTPNSYESEYEYSIYSPGYSRYRPTCSSALHKASKNNSADAINVLTENLGLNPNEKQFYTTWESNKYIKHYKDNSLHIASKNNSNNAAEALLAVNGINVNSKNDEKDTALHIAAKNNNSTIVDALLRHDGINLNVKNADEKKPIDIAFDQISSDSAIPVAVGLKKAGARFSVSKESQNKINSKLNQIIEDGALVTAPDKVRDMFFIGAKADMSKYSFTTKETLKNLQKEAKRIPVKNSYEQIQTFATAELQRKQQQFEAECCVIM